ncbi:DUF58 domain-containing protein [Bacillaceae bacterium S4-13-56]
MIPFEKDNKGLKQKHSLLLFLSFILIFLSVWLNRSGVFILASLLLLYILLVVGIDKWAGNQLSLPGGKRTYRMFVGDKAEVPITLKNFSWIPLQNGSLHFTVGNVVSEKTYKKIERYNETEQSSLLLSIPGKSNTEVNLSFEAQRRGVTSISDVHFLFKNVFSLEDISLYLRKNRFIELVVYPEQIEVFGLDDLMIQALGNLRATYSPYEDLLEPAGTRGYVSGDPFHRIHWKSSAKTQQLQTKVYERKWEMSWTIIVNVGTKTRLGNQYISKKIEEYLSVITYFYYRAAKFGIPIELHMNISGYGASYFKIEKEDGGEQLKKVLDILARIRTNERIIPIHTVLHMLNQNITYHRHIIFLGEEDDSIPFYFHQWKRRGIQLNRVQQSEEGYFIE